MEAAAPPVSGGITGDLSGIDFHVDVRDIFTDETFQKEIDGIFKKSWLAVCHSYEVPNPGDFKTKYLPGLKYGILIVRGKDNVIRAFHNVCRHRGNKLVCKAAGNNSHGFFSCSFHGWTFNIDGSVRGITDKNQFPPIDQSALGLIPIRCEVRHTFVFVNFDDAAESLDSWLEALAPSELFEGYFESFGLAGDGTRSADLMTTTVRANWNLCVDAFSESYHTIFVHKNTGGDYLGSSDNPMRHSPAIDVTRWHARLSAPANPRHKWSPTEKLAYSYTAKAFPSFEHDTTGMPPGVNFGKIESWAFDVVKLFPNLIFLIGRDWFIEFQIWPVSKDETFFGWELFLRSPKTYGERVAQEFSYALSKEIGMEDLKLLEIQQQALESGAIKDFYLSFQELFVAQHYRNRARLLADTES